MDLCLPMMMIILIRPLGYFVFSIAKQLEHHMFDESFSVSISIQLFIIQHTEEHFYTKRKNNLLLVCMPATQDFATIVT